jgi:hypothetical protein
MRFVSRRDAQLVHLLQRAGTVFVAVGILLGGLAFRLRSDLLFVLTTVLTVLGVACFWALRVTWYEVTPERLRIRCGPSRMAIPWANLDRVSASQDRRNAPALSFDRLQLEYRHKNRKRVVLVSPEQPEEFLRQLQQRAGLVRQGDVLLRRAQS